MSGNAKLDEIAARIAAATRVCTKLHESDYQRTTCPDCIGKSGAIHALHARAEWDLALLLRIARIAADALCWSGSEQCPGGVLAECEPHASVCIRWLVRKEFKEAGR